MRPPAIAAFLLGVVLSGSVAAAGTAPRVFGGTPVRVPGYMAYLLVSTSTGGKFCGATAISRNVVLTAAHCVVDRAAKAFVSPANVSLVFGQDDPYGALVGRSAAINPVVQFLTPQGYGVFANGVETHDIALLQTRDPVPEALPVLPPSRTDLLTRGAYGLVLGWGLTDMGKPDSAPASLMAAYLPLRTFTACARRISNYAPDLMLCAGDDRHAAVCSGDSGGPLIVEDPATGVPYVAGVTSYGGTCQRAGSPNVFANVVGPILGAFVATYGKQLQDHADDQGPQTQQPATLNIAASSVAVPYLTASRAKRAAADYAKRTWRWTVTRVTCARRSDFAVACRVNGKPYGRRGYFSRMLVTLAGGRLTISAAR